MKVQDRVRSRWPRTVCHGKPPGARPPAAQRAGVPGGAAQLEGGGGQQLSTCEDPRLLPSPPAPAQPLPRRTPPSPTSTAGRGPSPHPTKGPQTPGLRAGTRSPRLPPVSCRPHVASVSSSASRGRVLPRPFLAPLPAASEPDVRPRPGRILTSLISKPSGHTAPRLPAEAIEGRLAGCPVDRQLGVKVREERRN